MILIKIYQYIQTILLILLFSFLIYFNYPIWHTITIGAICIGILFVTKMRSLSIGMYMGATDIKLQRMIRFPFQSYDMKSPEESDADEDPTEKQFWMGNEEGEA